MSPLHINIVLHYYARTIDYAAHVGIAEPEHARSGAVREYIGYFVEEGILECRVADIPWAIKESVKNYSDPLFKITDKGRALVAHLCAVRIPVCHWVQPTGDEPRPMTIERAEYLTRLAT